MAENNVIPFAVPGAVPDQWKELLPAPLLVSVVDADPSWV